MKFLLLGLALLVSLAVPSEGQNRIVCTANSCNNAVCENVPSKEECQEKGMDYRPNSSLCGCCANCVEYIPLGGDCDIQPVRVSGGVPQIMRHCRPGSQCINNKCLIVD